MARRVDTHTAIYSMLALLLLLASWLGLMPPIQIQAIILAGLVVLLGLPHGALDPLVARRAGLANGGKGMALFLLAYIALAGIALLAWVIAPYLSLLLFLAASAWHFAGDWRGRLPRGRPISGGLAVILAPIAFHPAEVTSIFTTLTGAQVETLVQAVGYPSLWVVSAIGIIALSDMLRGRWAAIEIALSLGLAWALPPLLFFCVYFCGLHSPRHVQQALRSMSVTRSTAGLTMVVFSLLAGIGAAAFYLYGPGTQHDKTLKAVFIGLAVLTVPHMILIETWQRRTGDPPLRHQQAG